MKLLFRLIFIPVTALFLVQILSVLDRNIFALIGFYIGYESNIYAFLNIIRPMFLVFFFLWIIAQLSFEILAFIKKDFVHRRLLKHLRYAPIAASLFSIFIVTAFDFGMIELSKWRINRYVYQNSALIEKPDFDLHNDYRGWCGNGYFANTSYLYYETASTELNNRNSAIRARALLATDKVADIFNGTDRERFRAVLKNACQDSSEEVRSVAEGILDESILNSNHQNCQSFMLER